MCLGTKLSDRSLQRYKATGLTFLVGLTQAVKTMSIDEGEIGKK